MKTAKQKLAQRALNGGRYYTEHIINPTDWIAVKSAFEGKCCYCGVAANKCGHRGLTRDHFIPIRAGGRNGIGNIVPACENCQHVKAALLPLEVLTPEHYAAITTRMALAKHRAAYFRSIGRLP